LGVCAILHTSFNKRTVLNRANPIVCDADFNDITTGDSRCKVGWDLSTVLGSHQATPANNRWCSPDCQFDLVKTLPFLASSKVAGILIGYPGRSAFPWEDTLTMLAPTSSTKGCLSSVPEPCGTIWCNKAYRQIR